MCVCCASQHLGNQVTSASWLRKKPSLRDAKCRGSTGALCRKPGPKKGATNLPAGLLSFESRPQFWVRNLDLFFGTAKHKLELRNMGNKNRYAATCASANASWELHMS